MKPYYEEDGITIYHGDCRDVLPLVSPVAFGFADPPYNSGLKYGPGTDDNRQDYWQWLAERIGPLLAVSDRVLVKHSALKIRDFMGAHEVRRVLVWYKPFSSGYPLHGIATHWEPLYLLKGDATSWTKDVVVVHAGNSHQEGTTGHPAQFPEQLAHHLIASFSSAGEIVCDAFMGSGTTLRAAKDMGRRAIGIEIEERYCEIAAKRLAQCVLDFGGAA